MNPGEFRTYTKDCLDYKKLTQFTDEIEYGFRPETCHRH